MYTILIWSCHIWNEHPVYLRIPLTIDNDTHQVQFLYIVMSHCVVFITNQYMKAISLIGKLKLISMIGDT